MKIFKKILPVILALCMALLAACTQTEELSFSLEDLPAFSDSAYVTLNENQPNFDSSDETLEAFETYSPLDSLGRCGTAYANICLELMPTEERESIGNVKPSGWQTSKYDFVDGKYLYNRCHLIGFQLAGENANRENLITGTRYLNVTGMLPFENQVADYVKDTGNHVLYRVTPIFEGSDLVARGVQMEAWSVEDSGEGVCFNVYAYNNQPGVTIDYATGNNWPTGESPNTSAQEPSENTGSDISNANQDNTSSGDSGNSGSTAYILNTNSKKFHTPDCALADRIKDENRGNYSGNREDLLSDGYEPCGQCKP